MTNGGITNIKIIEFMGLPGCGKTTICKNLAATCPEYDFVLNSSYLPPKGLCKKMISFLLDFSLIYCLSIGYYLIINNVARKKGIFVYMLNLRWMYARFLREHRNDNSILLVDQGFVQAIGSMSLGLNRVYSKGLPLLLGFWKKISGSLLLVECEIPVELSAERLTKRNTTGGEFDRLRGIDLTNAMTSHVQLLKMVIDTLEMSSFNIESIRISTTNSVSDSVNTIINKI